MNWPLEFLHIFVKRLRESKIRFAITSTDWAWPVGEPFWRQHQLVMDASARHALPEKPIQD